MASSEQEGEDARGDKPRQPNTHIEFLEEPHGRHGGGEESEGRPQKEADGPERRDPPPVDDSRDLP